MSNADIANSKTADANASAAETLYSVSSDLNADYAAETGHELSNV